MTTKTTRKTVKNGHSARRPKSLRIPSPAHAAAKPPTRDPSSRATCFANRTGTAPIGRNAASPARAARTAQANPTTYPTMLLMFDGLTQTLPREGEYRWCDDQWPCTVPLESTHSSFAQQAPRGPHAPHPTARSSGRLHRGRLDHGRSAASAGSRHGTQGGHREVPGWHLRQDEIRAGRVPRPRRAGDVVRTSPRE